MKQFSRLKLVLQIGCGFIAMLVMLSSSFAVETQTNESKQTASNFNQNQGCVAKGFDPKSQQCADLIKQSKLVTVKLIPSVRASDITDDNSLHLIEFSAFIGGFSGQID